MRRSSTSPSRRGLSSWSSPEFLHHPNTIFLSLFVSYSLSKLIFLIPNISDYSPGLDSESNPRTPQPTLPTMAHFQHQFPQMVAELQTVVNQHTLYGEPNPELDHLMRAALTPNMAVWLDADRNAWVIELVASTPETASFTYGVTTHPTGDNAYEFRVTFGVPGALVTVDEPGTYHYVVAHNVDLDMVPFTAFNPDGTEPLPDYVDTPGVPDTVVLFSFINGDAELPEDAAERFLPGTPPPPPPPPLPPVTASSLFRRRGGVRTTVDPEAVIAEMFGLRSALVPPPLAFAPTADELADARRPFGSEEDILLGDAPTSPLVVRPPQRTVSQFDRMLMAESPMVLAEA